jgi:hypothetical protein
MGPKRRSKGNMQDELIRSRGTIKGYRLWLRTAPSYVRYDVKSYIVVNLVIPISSGDQLRGTNYGLMLVA